jgi:hypothetical protein
VKAPRPGVYRYTTAGSESAPSGRRALPAATTALVTPARSAPGLRCFGIRHRLSHRTDTASIYVLRGADSYVVGLGVSTPNLVQRVRPRPAILGLSDTETGWTGAFTGATRGSYDVELLGRRQMTVGGQPVTAVGVLSRARYRGEVTGTQRTRTWLSTDRSLVLAEQARSVLRLGGAEERLEYRTRLLSLHPQREGRLP